MMEFGINRLVVAIPFCFYASMGTTGMKADEWGDYYSNGIDASRLE